MVNEVTLERKPHLTLQYPRWINNKYGWSISLIPASYRGYSFCMKPYHPHSAILAKPLPLTKHAMEVFPISCPLNIIFEILLEKKLKQFFLFYGKTPANLIRRDLLCKWNVNIRCTSDGPFFDIPYDSSINLYFLWIYFCFVYYIGCIPQIKIFALYQTLYGLKSLLM